MTALLSSGMHRYQISIAGYINFIPRPFFTWRGAATSDVRFLDGHFFNIF
ncbi:MAG: hypothetical protein ACRCZW_14855 [Lactobacillaceae bacterium]